MRFNKIILLATIALSLASCTKENMVVTTHDYSTTSNVTYFVGGQRYCSYLQTDEEWLAFIDQMLARAEEGYVVCFARTDIGQQTCVSKETITYVTKKYEDAKHWAFQKALEGYEVSISFNENTGEYTCIATK